MDHRNLQQKQLTAMLVAASCLAVVSATQPTPCQQQQGAWEDFTAAFGDEEKAVDQVVAYLRDAVPVLIQQAFDAGKASNDAALATLKEDSAAHTAALLSVLPNITPATPAVPSPTA